MKLEPTLAQSIVDKMMKQIPYNINMMDETGTIIASGDKKRIGSLHRGAVEAISSGQSLPMAESYGEHGQPGVNSPVVFDHQIIGVIGITGDPEKVTPLASLLSTATELLISQAQTDAIRQEHTSRLNRFLHQWIQTKTVISKSSSLYLEAEQLGIQVEQPRVALALHATHLPQIPMDTADYLLQLSDNTSLVLTAYDTTIKRLTSFAKDNHIAIGIGTKTNLIKTTVNQALQVIDIQTKLADPSLISFEQVQFISAIANSKLIIPDTLERLRNATIDGDQGELFKTLDAFIDANGNLVHAATNLHIHRNTLSYQLNKIHEETGLNPRNFKDLVELYIGSLLIKLNS
ncbi:Sugar diacid utilization regulator SdaR [Furfurilactobacillus rossiae]|uniref:CdaR family transcriptional regulator n=1 Tax=Furfurilactobacillus rossiae TaxID=231049 RepID=UPI0015BE6C0D|nr:sugar diacid recognition domain-containing protein [Furfurilactobacillus rossiae]MCF6165788.1 helix-turn-helix domain-containing protein [Furfurilactobacillus rossiae]QLE63088.1 Sugar diacid utilization regulator SdaR [Furfurilactobacillus rossiae]